jgi:hypothetical protein
MLVEIRDRVPAHWTLVPAEFGGPYLVCPSCAERLPAPAVVTSAQCERCSQVFPVEPQHDLV